MMDGYPTGHKRMSKAEARASVKDMEDFVRIMKKEMANAGRKDALPSLTKK